MIIKNLHMEAQVITNLDILTKVIMNTAELQGKLR